MRNQIIFYQTFKSDKMEWNVLIILWFILLVILMYQYFKDFKQLPKSLFKKHHQLVKIILQIEKY